MVELCYDFGYHLRMTLFATIYEKFPHFLHEGTSNWNTHNTCFLAHSSIPTENETPFQSFLLSKWEAVTLPTAVLTTQKLLTAAVCLVNTHPKQKSSTLRSVSQIKDSEAFSPITRIIHDKEITFSLQTHITILGCCDYPNTAEMVSLSIFWGGGNVH